MVNSRDTIKDALHCLQVLNRHLMEENCEHTVKEIVTEALV